MLYLTPAMLEAGYVLLRASAPFRRWRLPEPDDVEFHVTRHRDRKADHILYADRRHAIRVSAARTATLESMLQSLAHEMIHVRQAIHAPADRAHHGGYFLRSAASVCRAHGWDLRRFAA